MTSTALQTVHDGPAPSGEALTLDRDDRAIAGLAPMTFEQMIQMGDALVRTGFLPEHIKTGAQAAAIILAGRELGMQPMRSVRSLQLVKGKVIESADSQLARFKADGGHAAFRRLDEDAAVLFLRHPNGDEHEESFTVDDARAAGLLSKDMYGKFRKAMLRSRAITAGLKSIGWEGGVGNYDPAEALAFSAPSTAVTSERTAATPTPVRDLAWALAYPFPFQRGRPQHGRAMGELDTSFLVSVGEWIVAKQQEKGDTTWNEEILQVIHLILEARDKDQGHLPLDGAPVETVTQPAAGSGGAVSMPKGGAVSDALGPLPSGTAFAEIGLAELTKRITALLQHEKFTDDERAQFKAKLAKADSIETMRLLLAEIETDADLPF